MRNSFKAALIALIMAAAVFCVTTGASAADKILNTTVEQSAVKLDKNGNEYVQLIIKEDRNLNGIDYKTDVVVMCFGSSVMSAKNLKAGDALKAIVAENEYRGRLNYNMVAIIQ